MKAASSWKDAPAGATRCWFAPLVGLTLLLSAYASLLSLATGVHGIDLVEAQILAANANSYCRRSMEMPTTAALLRRLE
jgi:hypothetical protein